jgi:hypothetical protein
MVSERELVGRVAIFLLVAVSAPLFEELFFRGVLYTGLRRRLAWGASVLLTGAVFAALHPVADWLPIMGLGVMFGVLREHRQSLIPGIAAHFLQNTLSFVSLTLLSNG